MPLAAPNCAERRIYARTYETSPLLIVASLWYLAMTILLGIPQSMIERYYGRSDRRPAGARPGAAQQEVPA
jgi:polar amino acid transport system permease protein